MGHIKRLIANISEDTPISIGLMIVLIGGCVWLTELKLDTRSNADTLNSLSIKADKTDAKFEEIKERLIRIEDAIKKDFGSGFDQ